MAKKTNDRMRTLGGPIARRCFAWALAALPLGGLTGCKGEPPSLTAADGERVVAVGDSLAIVLYGADPENGSLDYSFSTDAPDIGGTATIGQRPDGSGLFTWSPLASHVGDWTFEFEVSDGRKSDTLSIPIKVRGAVGEGTQPIFREPLGTGVVLPLSQQDCIELDILVEDADSTQISLTQEPPLAPGATLAASADGLEGTWQWCPRKDQVEGMTTYKLRLAADDGENPKVVNDFTVAVRKRMGSQSTDCPGTAPAVEHEPADFDTVRDLEITAAITDDMGLKNKPLLLYSTESPGDPVDVGAMKMVPMELAGGSKEDGTWRAVIPNPLAAEGAGDETDLYYMFTVADDDDTDGEGCDHVIDAPSRGTHRIKVSRPADAGGDDAKEDGLGACEPCSADVQCGGAEDLCIRPSTGGDAFCSQACAEAECSEGFVCSPNEVESVDGVASRQCVPEVGQCGGGTMDKPSCVSEAPNRSLDLAAPLAPGERPTEKMCPDAGKIVHHWYAVTVEDTLQLTASLSADEGPDFDLSLVNEAGLQMELSNSLESAESVTSCLMPGTYYLEVAAKPEQEGGVYLVTYDLAQSEGCQAPSASDCCTDKQTPGCGDDAIQSCVCEADPFCCDVAWDAQCLAEVGALGCGECELEPADCCEASFLPGCADESVQACVCDQDPLCCDVSNGWDSLCVVEVDTFGCGMCATNAGGSCCEGHDGPGCDDAAVEACVCEQDAFCCNPEESWDALCASEVETFGCGTCGGTGPAKGDCCEDNGTPGCDDAAIESCVCGQDSFCCESEWDALCSSRVDEYGCGTCSTGPEPLCTDTCQWANDGLCDDGGPDSDFSACELGTDCADCGPRDP